ncbi:MAG: c-type cytochrome biogenesis protein CcsB [Nostocoides sp.]
MNQNLADYANLALYSSMAVLTLSMLAYAGYLAALVPSRADASDAKVAAREAVLVGDGVGAMAPTGEHPAYGVDPREPARARKAAGMARTLGWLATALLVTAVAMRGIAVHRWPLGNMFEFGTFGSMLVLLFYFGLAARRDLRWLGLFITLPVLLVLGMASTVWYTQASGVLPSLQSYWLVIHVTVATIAASLFALGAATAGLYLWQARVEGEGKGSFLNRLPTSRVLERLTYSVHIAAFPLWTFAVIAGAIWARQAWGSYWNWDPKEVWSFVIWVVYAAYLHARATSGWSRSRATWVALAGFACIIINFGVVNVYFVSQHSYSGL